jgi:hypothetical protein
MLGCIIILLNYLIIELISSEMELDFFKNRTVNFSSLDLELEHELDFCYVAPALQFLKWWNPVLLYLLCIGFTQLFKILGFRYRSFPEDNFNGSFEFKKFCPKLRCFKPKFRVYEPKFRVFEPKLRVFRTETSFFLPETSCFWKPEFCVFKPKLFVLQRIFFRPTETYQIYTKFRLSGNRRYSRSFGRK